MLLLSHLFTGIFVALAAGSQIVSPPPATTSGCNGLQSNNATDLVQWDSHSLCVRGQRVLIWSGEYHPFRLPSPGLWLDVFQKIKALGYSAVSFYLDWALLEGEPGRSRAEGIVDPVPFMDAASAAGTYLIARPGPYINSEVSGGGFPGWMQRINGTLRTSNSTFLEPALEYVRQTARILEPYQIVNGGPIILYQVDNEYALAGTLQLLGQAYYGNETAGRLLREGLDKQFMADVETTLREEGIAVPLIHNDVSQSGLWAPGSGLGAVDVYAFDNYPFGYSSSCANPSIWPDDAIPLIDANYTLHTEIAPEDPFAILEFQGGNPQSWGGVNQDVYCGAKFNEEWERLFYKALHSTANTVLNIYMTFGGTNWGNLGYPSGVTSYDQGAVIAEDRTVMREKYSEAKLQANFLRSSTGYLTSVPVIQDLAGGPLSTKSLSLTRSDDTESSTKFYFVRHTNYSSFETTPYRIMIDTTAGNISVPQLGNTSLSLHGRDAKFHVSDYPLGDLATLLYSTAEIFTWKATEKGAAILLYGGEGETHEFALEDCTDLPVLREGTDVEAHVVDGNCVIQWTVQPQRRVLSFANGLDVYLLWRNDAYKYWVLEDGYADSATEYFVIKAGYLLRNASIDGHTLHLNGDVNTTTDIEVIAAPAGARELTFNGNPLACSTENGNLKATVDFAAPAFDLPQLAQRKWSFIDSLPELRESYSDEQWTSCDLVKTYNTLLNLSTPTSLYSGDYGYHAGSFLYRGHFTANGEEASLALTTQGGMAYGASVWLDEAFLDSWVGNATAVSYTQMLQLPPLNDGTEHVITVLIDQMGYELNFLVGADLMKTPRGILNYTLSGHEATDVAWKMTGNLGGEQYRDLARGPLNEGSLFAERHGYHLPYAPVDEWTEMSPLQGISKAGVGFFYTSFTLDLPAGVDIPISVVLNGGSPDTATDSADYRCQIFVNGYQMGKYINNLGPQARYPVPEGILNHHGENFVALSLWALDKGGAKLLDIALEADAVILSGYGDVAQAPQPAWQPREHVY